MRQSLIPLDFDSTGESLDVDLFNAGTQRLITLASDLDQNGILDVIDALNRVEVGSGNDYAAGLSTALDTIEDEQLKTSASNIVFLAVGKNQGEQEEFEQQITRFRDLGVGGRAAGLTSDSSILDLQEIYRYADPTFDNQQLVSEVLSLAALSPSIPSLPSGNASFNTVRGNVIANNGRAGVWVFDALANFNRITENEIYANDGLGINLGYSRVAANDSGDEDLGGNGLQNYPVIRRVQKISNTDVIAEVELDAQPFSTFQIEFYGVDRLNSNGTGQGRYPLDIVTVTSDGVGRASFTQTLSVPGDVQWITATATLSQLSTSEFSAPKEFEAAALNLVASVEDVLETSEDFILTVQRSGDVDEPLEVELSVDSTGFFNFPNVVTIPSGESTFQVTVNVLDNLVDELDDISLQILATARNGDVGAVTVHVIDDDVAPEIVARTPGDDTLAVGLLPTIEFEFDRPVGLESGTFQLIESSTSEIVQEFTASDVTISGASFEIGLTELLRPSTEYSVAISSGAFVDSQSGVQSQAVDLGEWTFTTTETNYWHLSDFPLDVDGDGRIRPRDALLVINQINRFGTGALNLSEFEEPSRAGFVDVTNDGRLLPIDALMVINVINSGQFEGEGEFDEEFSQFRDNQFSDLNELYGFLAFEQLRKRATS